MILKAESFVDGVATPLALNYTVESNILPKNTLKLNKNFLAMWGNHNMKSKMSVSVEGGMTNNLYGRYPCPFYYGSILLTEESKVINEDPMFQMWAQEDFIVGVADAYTTYSGSSAYNGTINKKETYFNYDNPNDLHYHLVYDFPTHAANNREIKEVTFLQRPYVASNANSGSTNILANKPYRGSGIKPWIYDPLVYIPDTAGLDPSYVKFGIDKNDNVISLYRKDVVYINHSGLGGRAVFADADLKGMASKTVFVRDNKFCFCAGVNIAINSNTTQINLFELSDVYFDEVTKANTIRTTKRVMPVPKSPFGSYNWNIQRIFEWDGFMYMVIRYGRHIKVVKYNLELTEIVKISEQFSNVCLSSDAEYIPFSIIHLPDVNKCMLSQGGSSSADLIPFIFDKELNYEAADRYNLRPWNLESKFFYEKLPNSKAYGVADPISSDAVYNGFKNFVIGYAENMDRDILRFKLGTPLIKKPDEVLKLTFDIHIKDGEVYTE